MTIKLNKPQYIFWALGLFMLLLSYAVKGKANLAIQITNTYFVFALSQFLLVLALFALLSGAIYMLLQSRLLPKWIRLTHLFSLLAALIASFWSYQLTMRNSLISLQSAQMTVVLTLLLFGLSVLALFALLFQLFIGKK